MRRIVRSLIMSVIIEGEKLKSFEPKDSRFPEASTSVSIIGCSLRDLSNFPSLPKLIKLDLSDNSVRDGLDFIVTRSPELEILCLGANYLKTIESLEPLFKLSKLRVLDLELNPVSDIEGFSKNMFEKIPSLEVLNSKNKDGDEVEVDEDYEAGEEEEYAYDEGEGEHDNEEGDDERFDLSKLLDVNNEVSDGDDEDYVPEKEDEDDDDIPEDEEDEEEEDELVSQAKKNRAAEGDNASA